MSTPPTTAAKGAVEREVRETQHERLVRSAKRLSCELFCFFLLEVGECGCG